jgi:quinol monooxygenase YgiN
MLNVALLARLEAKPDKAGAVEALLKSALALANEERLTPVWFALRLGPTTFCIFDAFAGEAGREAHLNGPIAAALMAQAPELLSAPPQIDKVEVLAVKMPQ